MLVQQISNWKCGSELKMKKIMTELELRESNEEQKERKCVKCYDGFHSVQM